MPSFRARDRPWGIALGRMHISSSSSMGKGEERKEEEKDTEEKKRASG